MTKPLRDCPKCEGAGLERDEEKKRFTNCPYCDGTGLEIDESLNNTDYDEDEARYGTDEEGNYNDDDFYKEEQS